MLYLIFVAICCYIGVVTVKHCIRKKNDRIRKRYSGETKIIKLPPSSRVKNWMDSPKNDPLPKEEQHPQAELQRQNDEMFWHMIQNCRF